MEVYDQVISHNGDNFRIYVVSVGGNDWAQILRLGEIVWQRSERKQSGVLSLGDRLSTIIRAEGFNSLRSLNASGRVITERAPATAPR